MSDQATADAINEAIEEPTPHMSGFPDTTAELLRGLYDADKDKWHTEVEVRELTGEDEEHLASLEKKKGLLYAEYMTALLTRAIVRIGDLEIPNGTRGESLVNKLMLADRDVAYLAVVKATYGNARTVHVPCPECNTMNDVTLELDKDFQMKYPDFDLKKGIEVEISTGTVRLRLPNGQDSIDTSKSSKTDAEINTAMIAQCAVWADGDRPDSPMGWARGLRMADRKKLVNALLEVEIGPNLEEVETQCASCGKDMPILLDWVSLLFG